MVPWRAVCVALRAALGEDAAWQGVIVTERDSVLTVSGFRPDQVRALAAVLGAAAAMTLAAAEGLEAHRRSVAIRLEKRS